MDQVPFSQTKEGSLFGEPRVNCLRINNPVSGGIELIEQRPLFHWGHRERVWSTPMKNEEVRHQMVPSTSCIPVARP